MEDVSGVINAVKALNYNTLQSIVATGQPSQKCLEHAFHRALDLQFIEALELLAPLVKPDTLTKAFKYSAKSQKLASLKTLSAYVHKDVYKRALNKACETDSIEAVRFLMGLGVKPTIHAFQKAKNAEILDLLSLSKDVQS